MRLIAARLSGVSGKAAIRTFVDSWTVLWLTGLIQPPFASSVVYPFGNVTVTVWSRNDCHSWAVRSGRSRMASPKYRVNSVIGDPVPGAQAGWLGAAQAPRLATRVAMAAELMQRDMGGR